MHGEEDKQVKCKLNDETETIFLDGRKSWKVKETDAHMEGLSASSAEQNHQNQ